MGNVHAVCTVCDKRASGKGTMHTPILYCNDPGSRLETQRMLREKGRRVLRTRVFHPTLSLRLPTTTTNYSTRVSSSFSNPSSSPSFFVSHVSFILFLLTATAHAFTTVPPTHRRKPWTLSSQLSVPRRAPAPTHEHPTSDRYPSSPFCCCPLVSSTRQDIRFYTRLTRPSICYYR
jgi:hypothetical protein